VTLEPRDADIVSGASIDGFSFEMAVPLERVTRHLRRFGPLRIAEGASRGKNHVLTCDVWRVTDGRAMPGGLDQHDAAARWGSLAGGLTGAMWGAALGFLSAARTRAAPFESASDGARQGYSRGSGVAARYARDVSRRLSLGPYHELVLGVPDVCVGDGNARYTAILAMVTDDALAESVDRLFGYGYDKQRGRFSFADAAAFDVAVGGRPLLAGRLSRDDAAPGAEEGRVNGRWAQPLLGGLRDGTFRVSRLERRIDGTTWWKVRGAVEVHAGAIALPVEGTVSAAGAVGFTGVSTRISRPAAIAE
jgi:hypothetical protein